MEEKAMSDNIDVNQVSDKQARRAEHIEDKLENKGLGHDQAEKDGSSRPWRKPATAPAGPKRPGRPPGTPITSGITG